MSARIGGNWGLIGHEWAVEMLAARLAAGRLAHAYLLTGPPGIGKMALAVRLAQAINCLDPDPPCGVCRPCDLIGRGLHSDVQIVAADGRSIKIDAVRDLQRDVILRPLEARSRIAIIQDAQAATGHAADALLKLLEEPPPTTRLLLTAEAASGLPPTIASRCQAIPLRPVPAERIAAALREQLDLAPEQAVLIARLSGGRPGWALEAAANPDLLTGRAEQIGWLIDALHAGRTARFALSEALARHDALPHVLDVWQSWWRDAFLLAEGSQTAPVNADHLDDLRRVAAAITPQQARLALRAIRRTLDALDRNANTRLAVEVMLLDLPVI